MAHRYAVWFEGGGVGKTTLSAGLVKAHQIAGRDVLAIDLDGQDGGLTAHYNLHEHRDDDLSFVDFLQNEEGDHDIDEVIFESDGVDIIPSHNRTRSLDHALARSSDPFVEKNPAKQLDRVIEENGLDEEYDVILIDTPATNSDNVDNAVYAAENILIPMELSRKGDQNIQGMIDVLETLERAYQLDILVLGVVLNKDQDMKINAEIREKIEESVFPLAPISFRKRGALFQGAWDAGVSPFTFFQQKDRQPSRERETLEKFMRLERFVIERMEGAKLPEATEAAMGIDASFSNEESDEPTAVTGGQ